LYLADEFSQSRLWLPEVSAYFVSQPNQIRHSRSQ